MFLFIGRVCFSLPEAFEIVVVWFCRLCVRVGTVGTVVASQTTRVYFIVALLVEKKEDKTR